jgi:hypothetical protein
MSNMQGQLGELKMMIQITRKETGKVEEHEMTSSITDVKIHEQLLKELGDGRNTLDSK